MSRCWLEIDSNALVHNARLLRRNLPAGAAMMAVVKADGYGHWAPGVVRALRDEVEFFGVATLEEASALKEFVAPERLFIMSALRSEEWEQLVTEGWTTWIASAAEASHLAAIGQRLGRTVVCHLKIDTGMGRLGVLPEGAPDLLALCQSLPGLRIAGIATHLPVADEDENATRTQIAGFEAEVAALRAAGFDGRWVHACNSAGSMRTPCGNLFRIGLSLYGESPIGEPAGLLPVITWKTRITAVRTLPAGHGVSYGSTWITPRPTTLGVLSVGYADGYPRALSNRGTEVLVRGRRCPLRGRVTMDQIMIDLTDLPGVGPGEEAILMGDGIPAHELAERADTIAWEIFTNLSRPRVGHRWLPGRD